MGNARRGAEKNHRQVYEQYITSPAWSARRFAYFQRHVYECRACGAGERLHLHHVTYERMGNEYDDDLMPLCEPCHVAVHKYHAKKHAGKSLASSTAEVVAYKRGEPVGQKRTKRRRSAKRPQRAKRGQMT